MDIAQKIFRAEVI